MTMFAKFAGRCRNCNGEIAVGERILWVKGFGAAHATMAACQSAKPVEPKAPAPIVKAGFSGSAIVAFITQARERGLKFPKVRFLHAGAEMRISLAGARSKAPGSINVLIGDEWIGRVEPDGTMRGALKTRDDVQATLARIAADPVTCAKEYGALMGRCSFCNLQLTDAGSVEVGYGPVCAKHYGLPHHPKGTPDVHAAPLAS